MNSRNENLLAVSYPEFSEKDLALIEQYRRSGDSLYPVIGPHFTLVFPLTARPDVFIDGMALRLSGHSPIEFDIARAVMHQSELDGTYHAFLVPDSGYTQIKNLHESLYSGSMIEHRRLDIEYVPHITFGRSVSSEFCREMVDEWNAKKHFLKGILSSVDIVKYEKEKVTSLHKFILNSTSTH